MENVKPCPFCGSNNLGIKIEEKIDNWLIPIHIHCICGATGPLVYLTENTNVNEIDYKAIAEVSGWNKRNYEN